MTMLWQNGITAAHRLRLRGTTLDPLTARSRLAGLLNATELHPAGLAPSAIMCVRTLRDPLPGALSLRHGGELPSRAWERAVNTSLEQLVRRAARPLAATVPANAEAVLFADRAELLACLASDWCDGYVSQRWWWQSLFKGIDLVQSVLAPWLEAATYAPAALQYLAERKKVVPFVQQLSSDAARTLLLHIIRSFALYELESRLDLLFAAGHIRAIENKFAHRAPSAAGTEVPLSTEPIHKPTTYDLPWRHWIPESAEAALQVEQQCLLGIGLLLRRAPVQVRTSLFTRAIQQWVWQFEPQTDQHATKKQTPYQQGSLDDIDPTTSFLLPSLESAQLLDQSPDRENALLPDLLNHAYDHNDQPLEVARGEQPLLATKDDGITSQANADEGSAVQVSNTASLLITGSPIKKNAIDLEVIAISDRKDLQASYVATAFGGIFYLLNLAIALDLYGDFTTPLSPGIPLDIWDFVALLALRLVGARLCDDPAWSLLGQLARRVEPHILGGDFMPPDSWRLPSDWLNAFPEKQGWRWSVEGERLRVSHPARFLVLDLPLTADEPVLQLRQDMLVYGEVELARHHPTMDAEAVSDQPPFTLYGLVVAQPLERWLDRLMPYIHARLQRALDLTSADELAQVLCLHRASIECTATHLDIFLSLQELPLAIRLAGLDRDPGWIPAAGRYVAFHFQ